MTEAERVYRENIITHLSDSQLLVDVHLQLLRTFDALDPGAESEPGCLTLVGDPIDQELMAALWQLTDPKLALPYQLCHNLESALSRYATVPVWIMERHVASGENPGVSPDKLAPGLSNLLPPGATLSMREDAPPLKVYEAHIRPGMWWRGQVEQWDYPT